MMLELLFLLTVGGNVLQYFENQEIQQQLDQTIQANHLNSETIDDISRTVEGCNEKLVDWNNLSNGWKSDKRDDEQRIKELENSLNSSDWGRIRIPDGLEF